MTPVEDFRRQGHTRGRGVSAEEDGVAWLRRRGLEILDRNVEYRAGEIDVVARDGDTLCFIEIKARASGRFGGAVRAVGRRKQRQIAAAAALYLATHAHDGPCRFDVLAMDADGTAWRYTYLQEAFELGGA